MAALKNLVFISMASLIMCANFATATRNVIHIVEGMIKASAEGKGDGEGGLVECGNALMELKSCSKEIVVYFLNGKADIGPDCCEAILTITRHCWPAMLTSLGITAEQRDILRGYCDAAAVTVSRNTATNAPAAAPITNAPATPLTSW